MTDCTDIEDTVRTLPNVLFVIFVRAYSRQPDNIQALVTNLIL